MRCGLCSRTASEKCDFVTCPHRDQPLEAALEVFVDGCRLCRKIPPAKRDLCPWVTCPHIFGRATGGARSIRRMSGEEFEFFVREQLLKQGYDRVETTAVSGDMGADLIARRDGKTIVVQCKRYSAAVGIQAVQEVLGAKLFYAADEAWVITDSTFTEAARKLARAADVRLRRLAPKAR